MKRFQFRLHAVEKQRKLQEQEKQVRLSRALTVMQTTEKSLLDVDTREVWARREFAALGGRGGKDLKSARFWVLDQFIEGQKVRRQELKGQLRDEEAAVAEAYREFLKARQQKKIIETLREKKYAQYRKAEMKHEMKRLDDIYTMGNKRLGLSHWGEDEE